jgi:hypothetical protein
MRRFHVTRSQAVVVIGVLVFAAVGVALLSSLHASTPTAVTETEAGLTGTCTTKVTDTTASNKSAVKLGTCTSTGFVHPGVLLGLNQLNLTKTKAAAGAQPWAGQVASAKGSSLSTSSYVTHAIATVQCGASSNPDIGCTNETNDASAAYTQAILWYYTGNSAYAQKARSILNDWSSTLKQHTDYNMHLQAAWAAELFVPAAEILRYTYSGWTTADTNQFTSMLNTAFLPVVQGVYPGGGANWIMSMSDAVMDIGVFENNRTLFNTAVSQWRTEVPSIIYMSTDTNPGYTNLKNGSYPIPPPGINWVNANVSTTTLNNYWHNPGQYENGLEGETCRDISHTTMGLEAMSHVAQTAELQGVDLYGEQKTRIVAAYEFNTRYFAQQLSTGSVPSWLCGGKLVVPDTGYTLGDEFAYAHYAVEGGVSMPYTKAFIDSAVRPSTAHHRIFMAWPTLTGAQN